MSDEIETDEAIPLPPKRRSGRSILLSVPILLVLVGATIFLSIHQLNQNRVSFANAVPDLPTAIHWQQVQSNAASPTLVAAPSDPMRLYVCNRFALLSRTGFAFARSTDAGVHWQTFATTFSMYDNCEIVVNPTNADELYIVLTHIAISYENGNVNPTYLLERSSDGGQTWKNIATTLHLPSGQSTVWEGGDLTFVGRRLFAVQEIHAVDHLLSSADGGQNWTVVDAQLFRPHQELLSYAVDLAQISTIYELVGPIVRFEFKVFSGSSTPPPMPTPAPLLPGQFYKTTDGGSTWQELLASVPYGSKIQLARSNSHLLYLGGFVGLNEPHVFQMQTSRDGGATWQTIALPSGVSLSGIGLVDANGLFYVTVENSTGPGTGDQALTPGPLARLIRRYNPSTRRWSTLNTPAGTDYLLAITPDPSHYGDIIWMANFDSTLFYRGTS